MNIGGLYSYPRASKDLWNSIEQGSEVMGYTIQRGEPFVVLEEFCFTTNTNRAHLKVLTTQGIIGWIAYIDKPLLVEVKEP